MFGYVVINAKKLTKTESKKYRAYYCGLCKRLGERYGAVGRASLTYDMTFLVLLLSSVYGEKEEVNSERCAAHPARKHDYIVNRFTDYAADMNVLLAYYKQLDDIVDDNSGAARLKARMLKKQVNKVQTEFVEKSEFVKKTLSELANEEKRGQTNPDVGAELFGKIMGEMFVPYSDGHSSDLRKFGEGLGRFIFIMDACVDFEKDLRRERYNPMIMHKRESFTEILEMLMSQCAEDYERLGAEQNRKILDNIVYSGIWTRYFGKQKGENR